MKTQWITSAYDPSKAPAPRPAVVPDVPLSCDALEVLGAVRHGYLSARQANGYLNMPRISVERAHKELQEAGLLIGIGKGTARRYLVNKAIG